MTPPLAIVPATAADAADVIELIRRVYAEYGFVWEPATEVPDLLDLDARYGAPRGAFFVLREGGRVVGSVGVERREGATGEIHRLYLDASLRGRGTGRALMEAAIAWCRREGLARVALWSDTRFDLAHRLYTAMGFRRGPDRVLADDPNDTRESFFERGV